MIKAVKVKPFSKERKDVKALYKIAFPENEQTPLWMLDLLALSKDVFYNAYYDGEDFVGLTYSWKGDKDCYLAYLATNPAMRSKGYGSQVMESLKAQAGDHALMFMVETPDEKADNAEQRSRRVAFYRKNGFELTKCRIRANGLDMTIMSNDPLVNASRFRKVSYAAAPKWIIDWAFKTLRAQNAI